MNSLQPAVCFVILNWNQPALTRACLQSVRGLNYGNYEVILIDNGSTDGSASCIRAEFPEVQLIHLEHNVGYSPGNNVGIETALKGDCQYLLLLNNDTEVHPDMLGRMVASAESDPAVGAAGPTMYYASPPDMIWSAENHIDWRNSCIRRARMGEHVGAAALALMRPQAVDYVDTCSVLVKREVVEKIGPMDERFFINYDDLDYNVRIAKAGYRILYVPEAVMWHKVSATMGLASPRTTYYMTRNSLLFFTKHAPGIWRVPAAFRIVVATLRTVAAWSLKSQYRTHEFRTRRNANLLAIRDFLLGRFGRMGDDVAEACGISP